MADLQRIGIWRLRELARQTHPEHVDEAARMFVRRILDMEVERRMVHAHDNLGWHTHSPMAPGFAPGGTDIAREPLAAAYDRGIRLYEGHEAARRWIAAARLSSRTLLALLIQARKLDHRAHGSEWGASYDKIAQNLGCYAQQLGWPPGMTEGLFRSAQAIKDAAKAGRAELILQAKAGVL